MPSSQANEQHLSSRSPEDGIMVMIRSCHADLNWSRHTAAAYRYWWGRTSTRHQHVSVGMRAMLLHFFPLNLFCRLVQQIHQIHLCSPWPSSSSLCFYSPRRFLAVGKSIIWLIFITLHNGSQCVWCWSAGPNETGEIYILNYFVRFGTDL